MKNCLVLFYNKNDLDIMELIDMFHRLEKQEALKDKTLICLPDIVSLRQYNEDELKWLLNFYKRITEELLDE